MHITILQNETDRNWLRDLWVREWGGETMITRGRTHHVTKVGALLALDDGDRVGAATCHFSDAGCELVSLNALTKGKGVGAALLEAVERAARQTGNRRVWLITSNDNLDALRFYQRKGYRIAAVYPGAIDEARRVKPTIPLVGFHGIPIHDEIELEKIL